MAKDTLPLEDETEVVDIDLPAETPKPEPAKAAMVRVETAETQVYRELWVVAERIANTEFVPKSLRGKPDRIFASMLTGREIGIGPMSSMKHVHMIDGTPSLSAEATLALIRRAGHKVAGEATSQSAEVTGTRADTDESMTITVTLDDALKAGWIDSIDESDGERRARRRSAKGNPLSWETHTEAMLWARAVTKLRTRLFSDVTIGWFTRLEEPAEEI